MHWQSSSLIGYGNSFKLYWIQSSKSEKSFCTLTTHSLHFPFAVYNDAGSCLEQVTVCVSDAVCNRYLAPVLQACMAEQCDRDRCQQVTRQFYGSMPHNVAEMLVMCECETSDQSCVQMKTALHSGTCGDKTWICQDTVAQCVEDSNCRCVDMSL